MWEVDDGVIPFVIDMPYIFLVVHAAGDNMKLTMMFAVQTLRHF